MGQNTSYSQMLLFLSVEKNLILKFSVKLYDLVWETTRTSRKHLFEQFIKQVVYKFLK